MRIPRDVSVQLFRRESGEVLFLMLRRTRARGGFWQGVTGAPLQGESDEAAAQREVREETGWDVSGRLQLLDLGYSYALHEAQRDRWHRLYGPDVSEVRVVCYAAEAPVGLDPTLEAKEHDRFGWFTFEDALTLLD